MQFISIFTYKPAKRDEVLNKRVEGLFTPEGAKCLGQWSDVSGGRVVTLGEVDDLMVLYSWAHAWTDSVRVKVVVTSAVIIFMVHLPKVVCGRFHPFYGDSTKPDTQVSSYVTFGTTG